MDFSDPKLNPRPGGDPPYPGVRPVITTYTGRQINPLEVSETDVILADVAHALALANRFAGHTREPIPVAQHSVYAARLVEDLGLRDGGRSALQALLHDGPEAYLGDVTKWLKQSPAMAAYREAEARAQRAVYRRYGCDEEDGPHLRAVDRLLVRYEGEHGFGPSWRVPGSDTHPDLAADYPPVSPQERAWVERVMGKWRCWDWREAESRFLEEFHRLYDCGGDWGPVWSASAARQSARGAGFEITGPAGPPEPGRTHCDFCHRKLPAGELVVTLHVSRGRVVLCDPCYREAGNDVR
jgi:hypothetical protein